MLLAPVNKLMPPARDTATQAVVERGSRGVSRGGREGEERLREAAISGETNSNWK